MKLHTRSERARLFDDAHGEDVFRILRPIATGLLAETGKSGQ
jgi:hypothetical protein